MQLGYRGAVMLMGMYMKSMAKFISEVEKSVDSLKKEVVLMLQVSGIMY